ncbi:hypothetical protein CLOSTMETH_00223 [[Clostridium] methylpentosum DSM 5476]|uniref:Uncharacterized protein n=1 Tax=[Clostridium] methylpentosum DSM 5476 TaxID=537013 RepID=C0E8S8_9FIRM|nr:hypothetical protein CLOSTMETH_00223 [[Clostridium] methylpentosum DSM 5476]
MPYGGPKNARATKRESTCSPRQFHSQRVSSKQIFGPRCSSDC